MGHTQALIETVLQTKLGIPASMARWGNEQNEWLFILHRVWLKLDLSGEGTGDLVVLTSPLGRIPSRNMARFHSFLLAKNFHLPGPSLWCQGGLFGLREVRYIDGLQDVELVDMIELMAEVSIEIGDEVAAFKGDGLKMLGERDERTIQRVAASLGFGL
jgi:hypothetical protein